MNKKLKIFLLFLGLMLLNLWLFTSPVKHLFFYPSYPEKAIFNSVNPWTLPENHHFGLSENEYLEAKGFVKDSIIAGQMFDTDSAKVRYICKYINDRLTPNKGFSEAYNHHLNSWQQWLLLDNENLAPYCVGYASVYHLFSTLAGLKTRMVAVSGNRINHIFCETYIRERDQWALTDIMFDNVLRVDGQQNYLHSDNYLNEQGQCVLLNDLCKEYTNATNFKYYQSSFFDYGYPFSYQSMILRVISPQAETIIKGKEYVFWRYILVMGLIYVTMATFIFLVYKALKRG